MCGKQMESTELSSSQHCAVKLETLFTDTRKAYVR